MKKTSICSLFLCFLLVLSLSGCSSNVEQPELPPVPEISADYVYLASENVYLDYVEWRSGSCSISLITATPLSEEEVAVEFGDGLLPEEYHLGSVYAEEAVTMPFYVYQIYRGKDWTAFAAQERLLQELSDRHDDSTEAYAKYEEMRDEYLEDYLQLQEAGLLPVLYHYRLYLYLPEDAAFSNLHTITLHINDRALEFPLGGIHYHTDSQRPNRGTAFLSKSFLAGLNIISANSDGVFHDDPQNSANIAQATEDVTITDIFLWEDSREISDIRILITQPNDPAASVITNENGEQEEVNVVADYLWDGKTPILLKKDERICVYFTFHDPRLANQLCAYTQYHLVMEYQTESGEVYDQPIWYPMQVEPYSADPHEIYLAHELGIDVLSYYEDYFLVE